MKISRVFFAVSLVGFAVGLSQVAGEIPTGFGLAMGGVFFILAFIARTIAKAEVTVS